MNMSLFIYGEGYDSENFLKLSQQMASDFEVESKDKSQQAQNKKTQMIKF